MAQPGGLLVRARGPDVRTAKGRAGPELDRNGDPILDWMRKSPSSTPRVTAPAGEAVPYAELHCHSNFSFLDGASDPERLIEEAVRLGLAGLAITDHDGLYAASRFAEAALAYELPTLYGAELSLGLTGPQNGAADPEGNHLLVLARGVEGYHRLAAAITEAQLRGDEKGRPLYRPGRTGRPGGRALADHDRLPQGQRADGPGGRRPLRRGRGPGRPDRPLRSRSGHGRVDRPRPAAPTRRPMITWPGWRLIMIFGWWPPTMCTTPSRRRTGWPRPWRPSGPGAV